MEPAFKKAKSSTAGQDPDQIKRRIKVELVRRRQLIEKYKRNVRLVTALLIIVCATAVGLVLFITRKSQSNSKIY